MLQGLSEPCKTYSVKLTLICILKIVVMSIYVFWVNCWFPVYTYSILCKWISQMVLINVFPCWFIVILTFCHVIQSFIWYQYIYMFSVFHESSLSRSLVSVIVDMGQFCVCKLNKMIINTCQLKRVMNILSVFVFLHCHFCICTWNDSWNFLCQIWIL